MLCKERKWAKANLEWALPCAENLSGSGTGKPTHNALHKHKADMYKTHIYITKYMYVYSIRT